MRIVVEKHNIHLVLTMREKARVFASGRWRKEAFRGMVDAGRRTKTQVQHAVRRQMAMIPYHFISKNTRGTPREADLAFDIYALRGGQPIQLYRGLRVLSRGGSAFRRYNEAMENPDKGSVRSDVWNAPRVFKRSFGLNDQAYAVRPGNRKRAPRILWTFGHKTSQPRGADGRFASSGRTYGQVRKLYGGSLRKEIPKGDSLATFHAVGPVMLEQKVMPRLEKIMRW